MSLAEGNLAASVERMARALEQVAAATSVRAVLDEVVRSAAGTLAADHGSASWMDPDGTLRTCATPGLSEDAAAACATALLRQLAGTPDQPQPRVVKAMDLGAQLSAELALCGQLGMGALVALPLFVADGTRTGVLVCWFRAPHAPAEEELLRVELYARLAGIALERERMVVEARRQAEAAGQRLKLLADASALLSRSLEWEETVAGVARLAVGSFSDWCAVDMLVEGQASRVAVLHADPSRAPLAQELMGYRPDPARSSYIDEVLRTGRALMEARVTREMVAQRTSNPRFLRIVDELGAGSFITAPMVARERIVGALSFVRDRDKPPYDAEDLSVAEELASRAALAMDNARLLREAREAEEQGRQSAGRLHLLVRVSQLVAEAGLDLEQVVNVLVRAVTKELGDGCLLQLVSEDGQFLELAAAHHPDAAARALLEQVVRVRRLRVGEGLQGAAVSTGQTLFLRGMSAQALEGAGPEAALRPYFERYGPQDVIALALVARGHACGSLLVVREARGRPYGRDDQVLLESIASRAALAIEDARLYSAALEALRLRDDFLSVAGHELKNPLNALQLQLRVLARKAREQQLSDSLAERAERVARTGERLGLLLEDLLDVSRITTGQLQLQLSEVDLSSVARESVARMAEELSKAGCEVRVEEAPPVVGQWDRLRLEQVVTNLLSNAAKYGKGRPVRVRVEAAPGLARLSVRDEGYGIAPEDLTRIFQRFQRAEATRHIQGLGLGLWICRQIVESHGGTLRVDSEPGRGSTFILELPRP